MPGHVRVEVPKATLATKPLNRLLEERWPGQMRANRETTTTTIAHLDFPDHPDGEVTTAGAVAIVVAELDARHIHEGVTVTPHDPSRRGRRRRRHRAAVVVESERLGRSHDQA